MKTYVGVPTSMLDKQYENISLMLQWGAKHQHYQTPWWNIFEPFSSIYHINLQLTICVCVWERGWNYWILNELCFQKNEFGWVKIREKNLGVWNCDQLCCFIIVMKLKNGKTLVLYVYGFWCTHWVNVNVYKKMYNFH